MTQLSTECNTEIQRSREKIKPIMHPNPNKTGIPSMVANYFTEKISYGLGWTTIYMMTQIINPFPIMLNIQAKLTLRDQGGVPYSRRLK